MHYKHLKESFKIESECFNKFDGAIMVLNLETTRAVDLIMQGHYRYFIESEINYSWDGAMFWFKGATGEKFLVYVEKWFEENYEELSDGMSESGVSNLLFYAKTKTGMLFVDTQRDLDSVIEDLLNRFVQEQHIDTDDNSIYCWYDDSHLIDNLCFGRDVNIDGNRTLYFLYQEGILTESILFNSLYNNYEPNIGYSVAFIGDFCLEEHLIEDAISNCEGLTLLEVPNKNTWVWIGDNVPDDELTQLKANFKMVTPIADVVKKIFEESFDYS